MLFDEPNVRRRTKVTHRANGLVVREPNTKQKRSQQPMENGYFIIYAIEWQTMLVSGIKHQNQK